MYNLNNIKDFAQCATWRKKINEIFNTNLTSEDIHNIFSNLKIQQYPNYSHNVRIIYYKKNDIAFYLYHGQIKNEIQKLLKLKNSPKPSFNDKKPKIYNDNINNSYIKQLSKPKNNDTYDEKPYYNNDENDMEKYSEYLINNVYENKNNMLHKIKLNENDLKEIIKESVLYILSESRNIKSKKLFNIIKQHGGLKNKNNIFDIHNLTDNDIIDVINWSDWKNIFKKGDIKTFAEKNNIDLDVADTLDVIELNDGKYILAKLRGGHYDRISKRINNERKKEKGDFEHLVNKKLERVYNSYPRKNDYIWNNKDAEELFKNPFFRKGEGNWTPKRKQDAINNIKNEKTNNINENESNNNIRNLNFYEILNLDPLLLSDDELKYACRFLPTEVSNYTLSSNGQKKFNSFFDELQKRNKYKI